MKVREPGHVYELKTFDGTMIHGDQILVFVKRFGLLYPGSETSHSGTMSQEVMRALIDRTLYVNNQLPCDETEEVATLLARCVFLLEKRAAVRAGRPVNFDYQQAVYGETCDQCGHVCCSETCRSKEKP